LNSTSTEILSSALPETLTSSSTETPSTSEIVTNNVSSEDLKYYLSIIIAQNNATRNENKKLFDELNQQRDENKKLFDELSNEIKKLRDDIEQLRST